MKGKKMEPLKDKAQKWIVGKYLIPDAVPQADKIIQELLEAWDNERHLSGALFKRAEKAEDTVKQLEQFNRNANEQLAAKQAIIENYNLDMLTEVFKKELEKQIKATLQIGRNQGLQDAAACVANLPGNHCKWIADDIIKLAE
jgi:hypothetical protein